MSSHQPKKNNGKSRGHAPAPRGKGPLPDLEAPTEAVELLGDLWKIALPKEAEGKPAELARALRLRIGDEHRGWEARRVRHAREALDRYIGTDAPASASARSVPALLVAARAGTTPLAVTFGGQSVTGYWDELATLYRVSTQTRQLVGAVGERMAIELERMSAADRAYLTDGVDVVAWLEDPARAPSLAYLNGVVSQPLTLVTQVGHFLRLLASGYGAPELWENVRAVAGHSQGLMAALLVSEKWGGADVSARACDYAAFLLYQAVRMRQAYRAPALPPAAVADAEQAGAGTPSPMASVTGVDGDGLRALIARLGLELYVGLDNGRLRKVVSGHPADLEVLRHALADDHSEKKKAKAAGRYAGALVAPELQYLPFGGAYHSPHMAAGMAPLLADCARMGFTLDPKALALPVLDNATGEDLRQAASVLERTVRLQFVEPVAWGKNARALAARGVRCILDFGPGEGVFRMTAAGLRGYGVAVLGIATDAGRAVALRADEAPALPAAYDRFAPALVETAGGELRVDNRYTRATGRSPVILPGMTPTTVDAEIVVAAANAGFASELAGGGQVTAEMLRRRLQEIASGLEPGAGVVLNALFLDPYLWKLQFGEDQLVMRLRDEGYPLVGVTVSAGIPPLEESVALLRALVAHGSWLNALKPGTDEQVKQVLAIADAVPEITFTIQIEGGKAGGHHSWEDLPDLLVRHYDAIRQRPNLLLAVGGGIATEAQATAYLTGSWSLVHELPAMPVDAVFIGTLAMATQEARTSPAVKQALVAAKGTATWVLDATEGGGVTSGRSQLDASIYYLENDAARCGRLLDALAKDPESIAAHEEEIVAALAKTAKPYFGDVEAMTYAALLARAAELMAIGDGGAYEDGRWLDRSHRRRFLELVRMTEARLHAGEAPFASVVQHEGVLDDPERVLAAVAVGYPAAATTLVHPEDARAFIDVCRMPGKPVSFVPVIDRDVRRWYKSDSLWQCHHPKFPASATHVVPGPEAVAGIERADEPVASLLGRFERHAVRALAAAGVQARKAAWSIERRRAPASGPVEKEGFVRCEPAMTPALWREHIVALGTGPLTAAVAALETTVVSAETAGEQRVTASPLVRLLAPVAGGGLTWRRGDDGCLRELVLENAVGKTTARLRLGDGREGRYDLGARLVMSHAEGELELALDWVEHAEHARLEWRYDDYLSRQRELYGRLIFGERVDVVAPFAVARDEVRVTREQIAAFVLATGDDSRGVHASGEPATAPLNMAFALAWRSIYRAFAAAPHDVVRLLHEDNAVHARAGWPVREGDVLASEARIESLETLTSGKRIVVRAELRRGDTDVATVVSTFFVRALLAEKTRGYERRARFEAQLWIPDAAAREVLLEQPWLEVPDPGAVPAGAVLRLICPLFVTQASGEARQFEAQGELLCGDTVVGRVRLAPEHVPAGCRRHPVAELCTLLERRRELVPLAAARYLGTKRVTAPADMLAYARASGDHNPLHLSAALARFAELDAPIVHGMWTASVALHRALRLAADGDASRLRDVEVRFLAPVDRGAAVGVRSRLIGMRRGAKVVELEAFVVRAGAEQPVMSGKATIAQPRSAYVFPGQGLQRPGMGMQGYARSAAARAVWDEAEATCRERLGFSLLRIVRDNPRELVVSGTTLKHPSGVLYLTQFTQVAMAVMAIAQVRELEERGAFDAEALFCGHSVGEYSALAAIGRVLPLAAVVEIVYQRGTTMDALVERDAAGRSPYAMGVIRPHYAGLGEPEAKALVAEVAAETELPIEIVNYNIRGRQYSVTGHVQALARLGERLAALQQGRADAKPAYLEVEGIDVPFHSTLLRGGVPLFRTTLERAVPEHVDYELLSGRYVPNLVAVPFALERVFAEEVLAASDSPVVAELLAHWDDAAAEPARLARTLLIELLGYQFASPVRWIETQDLLFAPETGLERLIEVGLAEQPILGNMAQATLAATPYRRSRVRVMHSEQHADEIIGPTQVVEEDAAPVEPAAGARAGAASVAPAASAAPAALVPSSPLATMAAGAPVSVPVAGAVADAPPTVGEALRFVIALQTKLRPEQLSDSETLDELLGGNSAKRNQVLADLAGELGAGAVDGAHEMPLAELEKQLTARAPRYEAPGKYLGAAVEQALARTLGGVRMGRNDVADYLARAWALGPGRTLGVILRIPLAARDGSSARGGALSPAAPGNISERATAEAWIDAIVQAYARERGVALAKPVAPSGAAVQVDAGALYELEGRLLGKDGVLARAAAVLGEAAGLASGTELADESAARATRERLDAYEREHGEGYAAATAPLFDAEKHVAFTSGWAWSRRDVLALAAALARGETPSAQSQRRLARRLDPRAARAAEALAVVAEREGRALDAATLRVLVAATAPEPRFVPELMPTAPALEVDDAGEWRPVAVARPGEPDAAAFVETLLDSYIHPLRAEGHESGLPAAVYAAALRRAASEGLSFAGKTALVTGAGPGAIALEVAKALLAGGARVVSTTSTYTPERLAFYKAVYREHAAPGAELHVVPANQGSFGDVDALVKWVTTARVETIGATAVTQKTAWLPEIVVPFGALGETAFLGGSPKSQAVMRVLLLGVERLVAAIAAAYREHAVTDRRCHVVLPFSPNHGAFGGDGLYAESKAALEAMLDKWRSEQAAWGRTTTLAGARIGWVRSTGLMSGNDVLAAPLEADTGVRTFAPEEMGLLITALCADEVRAAAAREPLVADLTGGFSSIRDLGERASRIRADLTREAAERRRARELRRRLRERLVGAQAEAPVLVTPKAAVRWQAPVPADDALASLPALDHLDLSRVVVIVGFGEVSPYGSARTRWAVERDGVLSLEAAVELAWLMGFIRPRKDAAGWEDAKSGEPVADVEVKARYEREILAHSGIRVTEPETTGFDPRNAPAFAEVRLEQDFRFTAASRAEAEAIGASDPEHTRLVVEADGKITVVRKRGAVVRVPRALRLDRFVAGQVPQGWDAERYGIPKEVCEQVDRVTLFNLVASAEAFVSAGMDPEEIYAYLHPSRVSTTQSSGIGGMQKLARLYRDYYDGKERQTDALQETLINVIAGYVVQSFLGSYGPMSFPVGACATAAVSVQNGVEQILQHEADLVVTGGVDDYGVEGAIGFTDMNATASSVAMEKMGIAPRQVSRPNDRRRRGFVEGQGAGALILCRASIAAELGLPVYGVVAYAGSFADGVQRSVPAPGLGTLASASEAPIDGRDPGSACDFASRRQRVLDLQGRAQELATVVGAETAECMVREGRRFFGHDFHREDPTISPLRGALGVLGLGPDDIAVVSKHDTSTQANDYNENRLHAWLQEKLGRTPHLPLAVISQKSLTGHPKGAAAAWQMNGVLQAMADGVVPGNRNLEDVDPAMADYEPLTFSDAPITLGDGRLRAALVTSLGFGHVGAIVALAHPYLFWRMLGSEARERYRERLATRRQRGNRKLQRVLSGRAPLVTLRTKRPFAAKDGTTEQSREEAAMLLDARSRLAPGASTFSVD